MSDPDHLNGSKITNLYLHWSARQKGGLSPFIVLNANPQHGEGRKRSQKGDKGDKKGKKKMEWVDIDDETDWDQMQVDEEESIPLSNDDDDEEMPLGLKFGPPMAKKKIIPPSTQDPSQVTGPSTLSPPSIFPASIYSIPSRPLLSSTLPQSSTLPVFQTPPALMPLPKKKKSKKTKFRTRVRVRTKGIPRCEFHLLIIHFS